jgi:hypothetical protein
MLKHLSIFLAFSALVATGCGDDDGGGGGADAGDAVDADTTDATPAVGACGVVVDLDFLNASRTNGIPADDITVVFSGPDGAVLSSVALGKGEASYESCVQGTMITVALTATLTPGDVEPISNGIFITHAGVNPGDTVYVSGEPEGTPIADTYVNISVSGDTTGFPDASNVETFLCGSKYTSDPGAPTFWNLPVDAECVGDDGAIDIIVLVTTSGNEAIAASTLKGQAVTVGAATNPISVPAFTAVEGPLPNANVVTNIPANTDGGFSATTTFIDLQSVAADGRGSSELAFGSFVPVAVANYRGFPADFGERTLSLSYGISSGGGIRGLPGSNGAPDIAYFQHAFFTAFTETVDTDLSTALPYVTSAVVTRADPARPQYNWLTASPVGDIDLAGGLMNFEGPNRSGFWLFVTPDASAGSFTVPALPEALTGFGPDISSSVAPVATTFLDVSFADYSQMITTEGFNAAILNFVGCEDGPGDNPAPGLGLTGPPPGELAIRRSVGCQEADE